MSNAGYGFGLRTFVAGVVLVRFPALGSFSGKLTPRLRERIVALVLLGGGSVVVLVAFAVFASASHSPQTRTLRVSDGSVHGRGRLTEGREAASTKAVTTASIPDCRHCQA